MTAPSTADADDLPPPSNVRSAAIERGIQTPTDDRLADPAVLNVVVAGTTATTEGAPADIDRVDGAYHGSDAGVVGRLAATIAGLNGDGPGCLHYPEPIETAAGPWLVIEPLEGRIATVSAGRGRVWVTVERSNSAAGGQLASTDKAITAVLEAARPTHEHYPVTTDSAGVFTTGMTTFELEGITVEDELTILFGVTTTPATTATEVEARFTAVPAVERCVYESIIDVDRAEPPEGLRTAVETAHRTVTEDAVYEWLPRPTQLSRLPTTRKMALGTGRSDDAVFDATAYDRCRRLIAETLAEWRGRR